MDPATERPYVLILEGLVSPPIAYRRMRHRLLDQGAAGVDLGPVHVYDWVWAGIRGFARLQRQVAAAIARTTDHAGGRPVMVVGHSGGGILARLAMSDAADGHRGRDVADLIGCLVTLGTPHDLHRTDARWGHAGVRLTRLLAERSPGAWHAPATAYLTVASDAVRPRSSDAPRPRNPIRAARDGFFRSIVGTTMPSGSDGVVSLDIAHLEGARQLTFHDVHHGVIGEPWYGDASAIERWWPAAVDAWQGALEARLQEVRNPAITVATIPAS